MTSKNAITALLSVLVIALHLQCLLMAQVTYDAPVEPMQVQADYLNKIYYCAVPSVLLMIVILFLQFNIGNKKETKSEE